MLFDPHAELGDFAHLLVAEDRAPAFGLGELAHLGAALWQRDDRELLAPHFAAVDLQAVLEDEVAVGRDRAGDDRLAEAEGALDHQRSRSPVEGSIVNITPERVDWIWRWTTTAMSISAWLKPRLAR